MSQTSQGSLEIEQTLRLARDAVESDLARYRAWAFFTVAISTAVTHFALHTSSWIPTIAASLALGYAVALRRFLARAGNRAWVAVASLVLDLAVAAGIFVAIAHLGAEDTRRDNPIFVAYVAAPALLATLFINALRSSRVSALAGAIAAPVVWLATVVPIAGYHPAQAAVVVILILCGVLGVTAAGQARRDLDRFARLQLLRRYLPPAAVERVLREDPSDALALGGRLLTVTLLAADLRGFTAMSEQLEPSAVMAQLNAYHGVMIDVIDAHGGAIDKFIGDGTLVVFGLTGEPAVAARAAVDCAAAMIEALARHNEDRARAGAPALAMGIGVHTGPVVAGNLGVPGRRLEFTVIGDAVNTASRLEGQTKALGTPVIVSGATVALLADARGLLPLGPASIRGKEQAVQVYGLDGR